MKFEAAEDREREKKAIELFVALFGGSYKKLDPYDIDYKVFDDSNNLIAYVEVKGRRGSIKASYPLSVSIRKLTKLVSKRLNPVIIWACEDGIIYGKAQELVGTVRFGGRNEIRNGSVNDQELMVYYDKQPELKYIKY